jgi:hypothetical protein
MKRIVLNYSLPINDFSIFTEVSDQKAGQSQAGVLMGACQIILHLGFQYP